MRSMQLLLSEARWNCHFLRELCEALACFAVKVSLTVNKFKAFNRKGREGHAKDAKLTIWSSLRVWIESRQNIKEVHLWLVHFLCPLSAPTT